MGQFCSDPAMSHVISKLQQHVDILEQATARVSSRAELHGAVQQVNLSSVMNEHFFIYKYYYYTIDVHIFYIRLKYMWINID